jgi:hypothetical protein
MPLTKDESKKILLNAFRLAIAVSERRADDATLAYSNILDSTLYANDDFDDDMPPLIPIAKPESNINLVISEIEQMPLSSFSNAGPPNADNYDDEASVEQEQEQEQEQEHSQEETGEEVEEDEGEEDEGEEDEGEEEEGEEEEGEEEVEEAEEEDEEELELEPVRIKKVIYWKDSKSGDIYVCLPEDEVGDKVGRYVDGKPVFD